MESKQINPEILKKTHQALIELNKLIKAEAWSSKRSVEICTKNHVDLALMSQAVKSGIFKRISRGVYKSLLAQIDPIHARQCIEQRDILAKNNQTKRKLSRVPHKKVKPQEGHINTTIPRKPNKVFSFLWGLFKVNY